MIDRIRRIFHLKKLSPSTFADRIGVPRSTLSHVLSERNNPSLEFVQKILDTFPDIRTEWLVRGEGNMLMHSNTLFPDEEIQQEVAETNVSGKVEPLAGKQDEVFAAEDDIQTTAPVREEIRPAERVIKTPEIPDINSEVLNKSDQGSDKTDKTTRKISRVLFFYSDGTFKEHRPDTSN